IINFFIFLIQTKQTVRWCLFFVSFALLVTAVYLICGSILLLRALHKEQEQRFYQFLIAMLVYMLARFAALIFEGLVNDPIYLYHQINLALWTLILLLDAYAFLVVYSNYQELSDLTKLE